MGKLNDVRLYAKVYTAPQIMRDENGNKTLAFVYLQTVRPDRLVEDFRNYVKDEKILVISQESSQMDIIEDWKENDIISLYGVLYSVSMIKNSVCPYCKEGKMADGTIVEPKNTINKTRGNMLYVVPIHTIKIKSYGEGDEAKQLSYNDIVEHREISNNVKALGTLIREPLLNTKMSGKNKVMITRYLIALNRKYVIKTDDPIIRTDYPIVASFGEQALTDAACLTTGSEIIIDGFLQGRKIRRTTKCPVCEQFYKWEDRTMELVPFDTEFVTGYKSNEDVKAEFGMEVEALKQKLFREYNDEYTDDELTLDTPKAEE